MTVSSVSDKPRPSGWPRSRTARAAVLIAGIVFGQAVLYGPSLVGRTVLLPLDLLAQPGWYLPETDETAAFVPHNVVLSDPVLQYEPWRRFAADEIRAGRLPLWNPYNYAGSPHVLSLSPVNALYMLFPAPITLAWAQLLKSLLAGVGAFLFFRRVLEVNFAPAAIGGICYPVTGFLVLWQAYPLSSAAAFLPWILLTTDRAVRAPTGWGAPALAVATALMLVTSIDIGAQALLAAALYAAWCCFDAYGRPPSSRRVGKALSAVGGAWTLGLLLAAPFALPLVDYLGEGARMSERARGVEERPPAGLSALAEVVIPDLHGSWRRDSVRLTGGNQLESAAATYPGFLATLLLAPLALRSRPHLSRNLLWLALAVLGLGWSLGLPGLVDLMRMPVLNMLSYNRSTFVSSFAILALAVTGLSWLASGDRVRRRGSWVVVIALVLLAGWLAYRMTWVPDTVAAGLTRGLEQGSVVQAPDAAAVERVRQGFLETHLRGVAACALALLGWLALKRGLLRGAKPVALLGGLLLADLLLFAHGRSPQLSRELYYPPIEALERLSAAPAGRVLGIDCLPPNLNMRFGLLEIRGYDAVDPARFVELLDAAAAEALPSGTAARTMWYRPETVDLSGDGVQVPAILDMLGVRYLVFRGRPPEGHAPRISGDDYWVAENAGALPRAFVPRRALHVPDARRRLGLLAGSDFQPRELAFVETELDLPDPVRGTAEIVTDTPTRVTLALDMETPGLVVLSDRWHPGWTARLDGEKQTILRTNHALRGVVAPPGRSSLVFSYEPRGFAIGVGLMASALVGLLVWAAFAGRAARARRTS